MDGFSRTMTWLQTSAFFGTFSSRCSVDLSHTFCYFSIHTHSCTWSPYSCAWGMCELQMEFNFKKFTVFDSGSHRPQAFACALIGIMTVFQSYPSLGDFGFYISISAIHPEILLSKFITLCLYPQSRLIFRGSRYTAQVRLSPRSHSGYVHASINVVSMAVPSFRER